LVYIRGFSGGAIDGGGDLDLRLCSGSRNWGRSLGTAGIGLGFSWWPAGIAGRPLSELLLTLRDDDLDREGERDRRLRGDRDRAFRRAGSPPNADVPALVYANECHNERSLAGLSRNDGRDMLRDSSHRSNFCVYCTMVSPGHRITGIRTIASCGRLRSSSRMKPLRSLYISSRNASTEITRLASNCLRRVSGLALPWPNDGCGEAERCTWDEDDLSLREGDAALPY